MSPAPAEGLLLVDKPEGPTSHDVVATVRRILRQRRTGHAGTLDPMATGLLPLVLGRATRLVRFLPHSPKRYEGELLLGWTSSTDDRTGELTRGSGPLPAAPDVLRAAEALVGESLQVPPAVSARRVGGERLYRLARRGETVEAPPSPIRVDRFDLQPADEPARYRFVAEVSIGTYVRGLVRDLGNDLGCGAVLHRLRRTRIGPMDLAGAVPVDPAGEVDATALAAAVIPLDSMPLSPPVTRVDDADAGRFRSGQAIPGAPGDDDGLCRVVDRSGRLLGVAEVRDGRLQPRTVLPELSSPTEAHEP